MKDVNKGSHRLFISCAYEIWCSLYDLLELTCFWLVEFITSCFVKESICDVMCNYPWNLNSTRFFIEDNKNFTSFSLLALILWFSLCTCYYVKGISSIHPIISCPITISLLIFWHVGKSMCPCQDTKCFDKRSWTSNNGIKSINIWFEFIFFGYTNGSHSLVFFNFLVLKFWQNVTKIWKMKLNLHLKFSLTFSKFWSKKWNFTQKTMLVYFMSP